MHTNQARSQPPQACYHTTSQLGTAVYLLRLVDVSAGGAANRVAASPRGRDLPFIGSGRVVLDRAGIMSATQTDATLPVEGKSTYCRV